MKAESFDSWYSFQIKETALATLMAYSYANLFMDFLHSALEKPILWLFYWWYLPPMVMVLTPSTSSLNASTVVIPSSSLGHTSYPQVKFLDMDMHLNHWTSPYLHAHQIHQPKFPQLHPPNTPSPSIWPFRDTKSAAWWPPQTPPPNFCQHQPLPMFPNHLERFPHLQPHML